MFNMMKFTVLLTVVISLASVYAEDDKCPFREAVRGIMEDCAKEYGVPEADIKKSQEAGTVGDLKPCFLSCVFKKMGFINSQGNFDNDPSLVAKFVKDDMLSTFVEIGNKCLSVNQQSVTDGNAGCERAVLLATCYFDQKSQLI